MIFNNVCEYYMFIGLVHGCQNLKPPLSKEYFRIPKVEEAYLLGFDFAREGKLTLGDIDV